MFDHVSLEQLEQQASQLSLHEQLKLIAHISARLSQTTQMISSDQEHRLAPLLPEGEVSDGPLYPTLPQPPESLTHLVGLVAIGGDALAESEALYDAD